MKEMFMRYFMDYKIVRIIVISLSIIISLSFVVFLFFQLWTPFGGTPTIIDKEDYKKRISSFSCRKSNSGW